jgi:hypothetical protein
MALFIKPTILYISQTIEVIRDRTPLPRQLNKLNNEIHFPAYEKYFVMNSLELNLLALPAYPIHSIKLHFTLAANITGSKY